MKRLAAAAGAGWLGLATTLGLGYMEHMKKQQQADVTKLGIQKLASLSSECMNHLAEEHDEELAR